MIGACGTTEWVMSEGFREGLFEQCILVNASLPIPFTKNDTERLEPKCYPAHSAGYVRASAALIIIVVLTDFFGTLLTGLGLRSTDPNKKYKYYRVASWALVVCSESLQNNLVRSSMANLVYSSFLVPFSQPSACSSP